jgi:hypothetical protein
LSLPVLLPVVLKYRKSLNRSGFAGEGFTA